MATCTFTYGGVDHNWSTAGNWDNFPADTDTVVITAGQEVTFDVDQSAWANGLAGLTVNGTMTCSTSAGAYYLKAKCNITVGASGEIKVGTSRAVPYPQTATMTFYFNGAYGFSNFNTTGKLNLYCKEPTYAYVKLSDAEAAGQTVLSVDTDASGDIWAAGDPVYICDVDKGRDAELRTIDTGGVGATTITVTAGITNAKVAGAYIVLCRRNVRILGSTGTSTVIINALASCTVDAEVNGAGYGLSDGTSCLCGGCWYVLERGFNLGSGFTISGTVLGCSSGIYSGSGHAISGTVSGCTYGTIYGSGCTISGTVSGCSSGIIYGSGCTIFGTVSGCTNGIREGSGFTISGATFSGNTADLYVVPTATLMGTLLGGTTENSQYNTNNCLPWSYVASYDHDASAGAFKAWTRGGIVVSEDVTVPTGYDKSFKHTCETASYAVFRQEQYGIEPGQTLAVSGWIKIADDHSAYAPRLEIIDASEDPLVDAGNSPLDTDSVADATGTDTDWQAVSVSYTNTGALPMLVWVRVLAKRASGDVYEAWDIGQSGPACGDRSGGKY